MPERAATPCQEGPGSQAPSTSQSRYPKGPLSRRKAPGATGATRPCAWGVRHRRGLVPPGADVLLVSTISMAGNTGDFGSIRTLACELRLKGVEAGHELTQPVGEVTGCSVLSLRHLATPPSTVHRPERNADPPVAIDLPSVKGPRRQPSADGLGADRQDCGSLLDREETPAGVINTVADSLILGPGWQASESAWSPATIPRTLVPPLRPWGQCSVCHPNERAGPRRGAGEVAVCGGAACTAPAPPSGQLPVDLCAASAVGGRAAGGSLVCRKPLPRPLRALRGRDGQRRPADLGWQPPCHGIPRQFADGPQGGHHVAPCRPAGTRSRGIATPSSREST